MSLKKVLLVIICFIFILGLVACGNKTNEVKSSSGGEKAGKTESITLRLADNQADDYSTVIGDKEFARLVKERTNGRINIVVYSGGKLGDEKTVIEQIQLGAIDFARVHAAPLTSFDKHLDVLNLPFLFSSTEHAWKVFNGPIGKQLLDTLKESKMVGLAYYGTYGRSFYNSKRPVEHPSDLKGMKIRVQQSDIYIDLVKVLGGSPVPMAYGEVYNALQTGVVDGAENDFPSYYTSNHYKVAKYYTEDRHSLTPSILLASLVTWNKLSPADQEIILQAARESQDSQWKAETEMDNKARKAVTENGNTIIKVNMSEWQEAVKPLYDKYGQDSKDLIEKIRALQ
ncbi:Solute-binding protein [Moorella humiferrea]|uniref:TRAP transporter substrate-binding protein n=1 Tax=Neomoorella humiferrea TaxID=676965 RepID=UPI0030D45D94